MKLIIRAAIHSARHLWDVIVLAIFSLCVFALIEFQLYKGVLTNKCIKNFPADENFTDENWIKFNDNATNWYFDEQAYDVPLCGNSSGAGICPTGYTCLQGYGTNPNYGYTNFDTFGWSLLSSYRLMTQDYWEDLYRMVLRTSGPLHMVIFFVVIFFGSFYLLGLILAVTFTSYHELHKKDKEEKSNINDVSKEETTAANGGGIVNLEPNESLIIEQPEKTESLDNKYEDGKDPTVMESHTKDEQNRCGPFHRVQNFVGCIILNPYMELFILLCIILCTLLMAMDQYDMSKSMDKFLRIGHRFFILTFTIEMILKLIALCPKKFFKDRWNIVDLIVVFLSILGYIFEGVLGFTGLSGFLLFRMVRVIRLAWPKMNRLITIMNRTISDLNFLLIMTAIGIYVISFVGMMLFGKNYIDHIDSLPYGELPRYNFTDFLHSFIVVFRAFFGEWIESMWDCLVVGDITCVPFFLCISILGNLFVMNLIVAVMLSNFCLSDESDEIAGTEYSKVAQVFKPLSGLFTWIRRRSPDLVKISQPDRANQTTADGSSPEQKDIEREGLQSTNHRSLSSRIIENKIFKITMKIIIVASTIQLAFDDVHLGLQPTLQYVLYITEFIFTIIFLVEMVIKWLALGFKQYFTNKWCCLDFLIVMVSVITFLEIWFGTYSPVYTLRALGPLRAISRWKQLRVVADYLVQSLPGVLNAIIACLFFWLFFAIMGVQMFAGKFYHCQDDNATILSYEIIPDRLTCITENYTWENSAINFDHVGNAYLALFQVATFKGWIQVINDAVDSREIFKQPIREINIYMYNYFVLFIICNSFFLINLFIGVIMDNFQQQIKKTGGSLEMLMTDFQKKFYNTIVDNSTEKPVTPIPKPKEKLRAKLFDFCTSKKIDIILTVFIGINLIVMMMTDYYGSHSRLIDIYDILFVLLIICTTMLKIFALNRHFFDEPWNIFDLVLVVLSVAGLVLSDTFMIHYFTSPLLAGMMRIVRVLRLIKGIRGIRNLLFGFARCLPVIFNIILLLFVVMCAYAIFGTLAFMNPIEEDGFDDLLNFNTFGQSMIILFQIMTTAGWDGILEGIKNKHCHLIQDDWNYERKCQTETIAILYLVSFMIISFFIIMNMFKVVVMENYSQMKEEAKKRILNDKSIGLYEVKLDQLDEETSVLNTQETAGIVLSGTETAQLAPAAIQAS